jgi:hypothetical protein
MGSIYTLSVHLVLGAGSCVVTCCVVLGRRARACCGMGGTGEDLLFSEHLLGS